MDATIKNAFRLRLNKDRSYRHWVLLQLNRRQTADERHDRTTRWLNRVGFSTADAAGLTSLAEKIRSGQKLSVKEERLLIRRLPKYWNQFVETKLVDLPHSKAAGTSGKRTEKEILCNPNSNRRVA